MVSGVSSNIIENFANFNESFHDRENGDELTAEDIPACQRLLNNSPIETGGGGEGLPDIVQEEEEVTEEFGDHKVADNEEFGDHKVADNEEFGDHETPVYEGFTNSDFNASNLVRGRNLHNLLKALLIALVLCSLNHKDVSRMVVEPLVRLTHNKISRTTMVCVLIFLVAYLVIALL